MDEYDFIPKFIKRDDSDYKHNIAEYRIALICNKSMFPFLELFVNTLIVNKIVFKDIFIGDAGINDEQKSFIETTFGNRVAIIDLETKNMENVAPWSEDWKNIIRNKLYFIKYVIKNSDCPVLFLDVDTAIISNDFSMLDKNADITINVREAYPHGHCDHIKDNEYLNAGVIFFHKPQKCGLFIYESEWYLNNETIDNLHIEQAAMHRAIKCIQSTDYFRVQKIHCQYYNCFRHGWINERTSILHFKSAGNNLNHKQRVWRVLKGYGYDESRVGTTIL